MLRLTFLADVGFDPVGQTTEAGDSAGAGNSNCQGMLRGEFNDGDTIFVDVETSCLQAIAAQLLTIQ